MDTFSALVDAALAIEKVRIRTQIRHSHLKLDGRDDPETDALLERLLPVERYVDGRIANLISLHPAYYWFSRVKGIGKENIAKIIWQIDIRKATSISSVWKFSGFSVENGSAPKREKGNKLSYNSQLRSHCWRVATSLLRAKGKFYLYYLAQKDRYQQRFENEGYRIVPAANLPKNNGKRYESEKVISEGHIHNMALRKMIKLFLACLWLKWREAEGLPITMPYAIDKLGHNSFINPDEMVDR